MESLAVCYCWDFVFNLSSRSLRKVQKPLIMIENAIGRFEEVHYYETDYNTFQNLVADVFGVDDFSFQADQEAGNDTEHTFNADDLHLSWFNSSDLEEIQKFKETGRYNYISGNLITYMVKEGILPKGKYLIKLSY
jgi:hypothetical protein